MSDAETRTRMKKKHLFHRETGQPRRKYEDKHKEKLKTQLIIPRNISRRSVKLLILDGLHGSNQDTVN